MDRSRTQRIRSKVNVPLLASVVLLVAYGTLVVSSATAGMGRGMILRHLFGVGVGLVAMAVAWAIDYQALRSWKKALFAGCVLLLVLVKVPGFGDTAKGANSWLQIAGVRLFQPSEPAKLILIVVLAIVISQYEGRIERSRAVARVLAYLALPMVMILLQPDLGTALVFVVIAAGMLLIGGLKGRWFAIFALLALLAGVALWNLPAGIGLKQYQKDRLLVFVQPEADPDGAGYNLAQSKIAIGSGEVFGKGLGSGTQSNLHFLPERHTDFIFSVLGEELGFVGGAALLGAYLWLLLSALAVAASSRDLYGALIVAGIMSMWLFQILENMGMTVGMMPITGIPLPFMSFGSSFMVTNLGAIGLIQSVWSRRYGA